MFIVTFKEKICGRDGSTETETNFRKFETKDELAQFVEFLYEVNASEDVEIWNADKIPYIVEARIAFIES